ncbi:hypothetical protein Cgig2_015455 [Carnegiea gigantea]|uniref:Uncharacterized protein n=1 Tax=Carnegiea gigantea TaxID=171969 RepID=A0A9Q1JXS3_9CARY|nr:hypothetical protein Cgig2_015455 [Carnegiea gigantea]
MASGGFLNLVERLDHEQWSAIMETGFGGMLAVRTRLIPKQLARWLLNSYDPWETSLKLPNEKVLIYEEDVHATLGLPMGPLEVREGKTSDNDTDYAIFLEHLRERWNIKRGGPSVGSMEYAIIERGSHGAEFIIDFIIHATSTCIIGNANGTCHFRVLNNLRNCAYVIKCLNNAVIEWKAHKTKFFTGSLLFLMVKDTFRMTRLNHNIYDVVHFQLFYLDRVEFKAEKVDRWFPIALNWTTKKVKKRERKGHLPGEYGRGRIIKRLEYKKLTYLAEMDL